MGRAVDLSEEGRSHERLTSTSDDGLLGGQILEDDPIETYLREGEIPRYLLVNKKAGLRRSDAEDVTPEGNYRAFLLVTDFRLLCIVGAEAGDWSKSVPLSDVIVARMDSEGFRTETLVVETMSGTVWEFPCRDSLEEVAEHVDAAAQVWANVARLLEEAERHLAQADTLLATGDYEEAREALESIEPRLETARERVSQVSDRGVESVTERIEAMGPELARGHRHARAVKGATAHAKAQEAWAEGAYEAAADTYDTAIDAYQEALGYDGPTPSDGTLIARLRGAGGERELLRTGPLIDAETARHRGAELDDHEEAADEWTTALELYREILSLDWGSDERRFVAGKERIQQRAQEVADGAIDERQHAGEQWLESGDRLARQGDPDGAEEEYERAREQFERAHRLAREVRPERVGAIADALETVEYRLGGSFPEPEDTATDQEETPTGEAVDGDRNPGASNPSSEDSEIVSRLREEDVDAFIDLVAAVWEARGWSTTVFSASDETAYDIVAVSEDGAEQCLLWVIHRPALGVVGETAVERAANTRDGSAGADSATVATTGSFSDAARSVAAERDVGIVGPRELTDSVRSEGLMDLIPAGE